MSKKKNKLRSQTPESQTYDTLNRRGTDTYDALQGRDTYQYDYNLMRSPAVEPRRTERQASCFGRAARMVRDALSRICRDNSQNTSESISFAPVPSIGSSVNISQMSKKMNKRRSETPESRNYDRLNRTATDTYELHSRGKGKDTYGGLNRTERDSYETLHSRRKGKDTYGKLNRTGTDSYNNLNSVLRGRDTYDTLERDTYQYKHNLMRSPAVEPRRTERQASCFGRAARMVRDPLSRICRDNSHNTSESRSYDPLQKRSDVRNQDFNVYQPLNLRHNGDSYSPLMGTIVLRSCAVYTEDDDIDRAHISTQATNARIPIAKGQSLPFHRTGRMINIECGSSSYGSLSIPLAVAEPRHPQSRPTVIQHSTACTAPGGGHSAFNLLSVTSESQSGGDSKVLVDMEAPVTVEHYSVTKTLPTHSHLQTSSLDAGLRRRHTSSLPHSHSVPALSQIPSAKNKNFTRAESLPDILLKDSFEEFTPDITVDENEETYRFHCSHPGLYRCTLTGLVFHMEGEGDMVYRIVPWNHRLLAQHHKKPAGPLFDIKCLQESVCQLHLPHCEIRSTGGCEFLSVAHVNDEGIEFISPHKITETHVIINITGFSGFGNVKDEDSPPDPVRALVLLFYRPPTDPDPESVLNVLLLPKNVVLRDVLRMRKKLVGEERYIDTSPHCKLIPKQEYTLSTSPEDDSVLVQPTDAEFDEESYDNYFPSFQVNWEKNIKSIKLFLRDANSSHSVWERRVCLLSTGVRKPCGQSALSSPSNERLMDIRTCFIDGISGPVLKSLLDKLFEKKVITESERESADEMQNKRDKARFVIDTVRKKGEAASSEMIEFLCEVDPFLCEHLGLI